MRTKSVALVFTASLLLVMLGPPPAQAQAGACTIGPTGADLTGVSCTTFSSTGTAGGQFGAQDWQDGLFTSFTFTADPSATAAISMDVWFCEVVDTTTGLCGNGGLALLRLAFGTNTFSVASAGGQSGAGCTGALISDGLPHAIEIITDWTANTNKFYVDTVLTKTCNFHSSLTHYFGGYSLRRPIGNVAIGDITGFSTTGPTVARPEAPAGLSATVSQAFDGDNSLVELRWPVSSDDPDQLEGDYDYKVYLNGVLVATDSITGADGDGQRFHLIDYSQSDPLTFWITATNTTTTLVSVNSCSVQIDTGVQNDFDTCGSAPGGPGGGPVFTTETDTAAGLLGFCSSLMGDSDGSLFLCGLIFVVFAFMALAGGYAAITGSKGVAPTIAGSIAAFGMMVFNVFAGIWGIVWAIVLIILVAAIITVVVKKFTGASGGASSGE